ncbi:hypothetical protein FJT64_019174 [Amphibalanus amphitrite]|uniref:Uncharacterized protein n=1 Tax=Amphibalanus amphitrite TaxID=1232801 RepID=A0A6A4X600_AMPAM|nr:hypothetical protein FJT64_019174 [Amphibalanus amphitrite]
MADLERLLRRRVAAKGWVTRTANVLADLLDQKTEVAGVEPRLVILDAKKECEIQELTALENWRHCRSEDNPADLLTRGVFADQLVTSTLWFGGPVWLSQPEMPPLTDDDVITPDSLPETAGAAAEVGALTAVRVEAEVEPGRGLVQVERYAVDTIIKVDPNTIILPAGVGLIELTELRSSRETVKRLSVSAADLPRLRRQLPEGLERLNVRGEVTQITHGMPVSVGETVVKFFIFGSISFLERPSINGYAFSKNGRLSKLECLISVFPTVIFII